MWRDHLTELVIFTLLFAAVAVVGFVAARWRRPGDMMHLDEWGLGGRSFGSWVTWFLVGGDLYTAYTFVAVPSLVFASGAVGFFAVPYTVLIYPMVFLVVIRLWSVSHRHGYVTPADFVRGRFGSPTLALLVAVTGIIATMPYIALQLVGIQAVLTSMGLGSHWPLIIAFLVLAAYTFQSGLRAPALIAFVKDLLIYVVILVAVVYIPYRLGGFGHIFDVAGKHFADLNADRAAAGTPPAGGLVLGSDGQLNYATLAFGSALALFLYPHSVTGVLASKNRNVLKRNMSALPAYSFLLGLIALLGFMAIVAGTTPIGGDGNTIVPELFDQMFPSWFAGVAFAAIGIGALVPAAIMSIAAANLFTRNIFREYLKRDATARQEAWVSKVASLVVKFGALVFILFLNPQFSIDLQLIGGVIILQTLPSVGLGLLTRWFHRWGLVVGWVAGMAAGIWMLYTVPNPKTHHEHFGGSAFSLSHLGLDTGWTIYAGFVAVLVNLVVTVLASLAFKAAGAPDGVDRTTDDDYTADEGDPRVREVPVRV